MSCSVNSFRDRGDRNSYVDGQEPPLPNPRFESSISVTTTASSCSSSYTASPMSPSCSSVSMFNYPSSSLSSLALHIASSSVSPNTSSSSVTSSQSTVPRNPTRKTNGGQHPLANVSTYDSDPETSSNSETPERNGDGQNNTEDSISTISASGTPNNGPIISPTEVKGSIIPEGCSENAVSKQSNASIRKSAGKGGSSQVLVLHLKPGMAGVETSAAVNNAQAEVTRDDDPITESEWTSVAVAASVDQPLSPLTSSYPTIAGRSASVSDLAENKAIAEESPNSESSPTDTDTTSTPATTPRASSSPRREFEKWTPPPSTPRLSQDTQRQHQMLRQPYSRLHLPRLLKHRSLNFSFSSSGSSPSSQQHGAQSSLTARAPVDETASSTRTETTTPVHQARAAQSCDLPRPVGPPDPIPPHYQHLQNRQRRRSAAFRRRSHGGELERFSPGWIAAENAASEQRARCSASNDTQSQDPNQRRAIVSRRHASLGLQPNLSSMWGRLLTSIFPSGSGSEHGDEQHYRDINGPAGDLALRHQRLLLTPLSQQQQVHPIYQQQLFFYEDEVVDAPERPVPNNSILLQHQHDEDSDNTNGIQRRSTSSPNSQRDNAASPFPSMASNVNLQAELAQEDGCEDMEMMQANDTMVVRPEILGDRSTVVPKSLSAHGKISVSSLALSPPPSYWEAAIKYKGWSKIETRPEQGQENLPRYTCSVFREGCVNRKTELVGNWRPYRRPWKRTFAHLRGTALRLYAVDMEDVPRLHVRNISLQHAKCEIASDYKQRANVIRIRACDRTVLLECKDRIDALTWLEHLQAAANIATSLEDRSMPKFYTLPRAQPHPATHGSGSQSSTSSTTSNQHQSTTSSSLSSSMDSQGSQQQQQQQSSMDQTSSQPQPQPAPQTRLQQMQQLLQEQQEQILMQQRVEQRLQRSQQLVVQSSDSASIMPSTLGRELPDTSRVTTTLSAPLPPSSAAVSMSRRRGTARLQRDHDQLHLRSRTSLMTRSERERNMIEAERRREAARQEEDAVVRSVLHAMGHSSDSGSCRYDSDDDDDDDDDDEAGTNAEIPTTASQDRSCHHSSHDASYRSSQHDQQQQRQSHVIVMPRNCRSQEFRRSSETATPSSPPPPQAQFTEGHAVNLQHSQRRPQRASWNRRLFGGLWGNGGSGHQQSNGDHNHDTVHTSSANDYSHRPLSLTASSRSLQQ
ncbi:hypothetical protein BGZ51_001078 [Haplosporangium sp. Z 767]|nr:hypothetical protein BGZ51_001078 [Haplosporangium sp. Z 767]